MKKLFKEGRLNKVDVKLINSGKRTLNTFEIKNGMHTFDGKNRMDWQLGGEDINAYYAWYDEQKFDK